MFYYLSTLPQILQALKVVCICKSNPSWPFYIMSINKNETSYSNDKAFSEQYNLLLVPLFITIHNIYILNL